MTIQIVPLGAGQDVGRSCILVTIGGKNIMLDCGMHMGFNGKLLNRQHALALLRVNGDQPTCSPLPFVSTNQL